MIFYYFQTIMKNLLKIKGNSMKKSLYKYFSNWRLVNQVNLKINNLKEELKKSVTNKYRKKLEESEKCKILKETENANIKKEIAKNQEIDAGLNTKIKDFENKELLLMQNIQKLENEKKLLEEEILIFSSERGFYKRDINYSQNNNSLSPDKLINNDNGNKSKYSNSKNIKGKKEILMGLEKKITEYERKINKLTEINNNKDIQMNLYVKEMNEIITKHEKTCKF